MDKLNNIMQRICLESKNKNIVLYEKFDSHIYKSLESLNITCQHLSQLDELVKVCKKDICLVVLCDFSILLKNLLSAFNALNIKNG
jgi:hypothetical protein